MLECLFDRDARGFPVCPHALAEDESGPGRSVCLRSRCLCARAALLSAPGFCVPQFVRECAFVVCLCLRARALVTLLFAVKGFPSARARSLPRSLAPTLAGRGTAVADHYRLGETLGAREFSGVCLRLAPLLNERCSISLIMLPLRLMSLFSDSKVCKKASLLSGLFAFLIGLNKSACLACCPAIHSPPVRMALCFISFLPLPLFMYVFACCSGTIGGFTREVSRLFYTLLLPTSAAAQFVAAFFFLQMFAFVKRNTSAHVRLGSGNEIEHVKVIPVVTHAVRYIYIYIFLGSLKNY